ncbi:peptidase domain-containing ABC transporter [Xanthomonas perforans]|nr:peptidase domain-containing ABC transporter [Xanthomonas perforans]MCT8284940.1 peptidase domain-containing ABC transporter [Xanthomonas translucens pv. translucens]MBZ2690506.1 peptidase domain-containing ABC transporter [Xanthomonas perforans]MBZ2706889.1 peptidase domain-containing ABC transporter [Xanthomonas perforans]MBZ2823761.1 peptidase domain-containing ABC transporter [Xanthomonas perforans]
MKVTLQSEASECGLACLAMILSAHGASIELRELRRRFSLSLKGTRLDHMINMAERLGLAPRPVRLEVDELRKLTVPSILHWDMDHFVVLCKTTANTVSIIDPASGKRNISFREASEHFTGVALELAPVTRFVKLPKVRKISIRELTGNISGLWRSLALIFILSISLQALVITAPFYLQWIVDQVLPAADRGLVFILAVSFMLVLLFQVGISAVRGWSVIYLSTRLGLQWTQNVFAHLLKLRLDFFEKRHLGDIVSRMASIQAIQRTLSSSFVEAIIDGMMAIATLAMMILYSTKLVAITIVAVALYVIVRMLSFAAMRRETEQQLVSSARQQSHLLESIRGIQSIKIFGVESNRRIIYSNLMNRTISHEVRLGKLGITFAVTNQFIFGAERVLVIAVGANLAMSGEFSVGMLIAYLAYKEQFSLRIGGLIDKMVEFRMLRLHGDRLSDIVLSEPDIEVTEERSEDLRIPKIEVRNLGFRYGEGEPWVIRDCSFVIEAGEVVAIIGPSGGGKTTLMKIMLGLLTPTEGCVIIDGQDIHRGVAKSIRRYLGAVMQDDALFAGSIAENIAFGDLAWTKEQVEDAAKRASIHDEIISMPMGYNSLIGDMGTTLSGGQKQRVILARALYRNPRILFLDEATSHLDVEREKSVNLAISRLDLTRVIVAHRPETIASAERVLLLRDGVVLESCDSGAENLDKTLPYADGPARTSA